MDFNKLLVVDIETTGFNHNSDCIVEIGIVLLDLVNGKKLPYYNKVIREPHFCEEHKDSWVFKNTSLTYEDVLLGTFLDINYLQQLFNRFPATAYNKAFDFGFLRNRGLEIVDVDCLMHLMTPIVKIPSKYPNSLYKWPNVMESYDFIFGKNHGYVEIHRGLDDAMHESDIALYLYRNNYFNAVLGGENANE